MIWSLIIPLFIGFAGLASEQTEPQQYILKIAPDQYEQFESRAVEELGRVAIQRIYPKLGLYRVLVSESAQRSTSTANFFENCILDDLAEYWQRDHPLTIRAEPNDALWSEQWGMMRIDLPEAWDVSTGGTTIHGDTIVVAVLDDGFELSHPDLRNNVWENRAEIQGDKLDNDQNGFVDDFRGVNLQTGNDQHAQRQHGTAVAGILAAEGGNAQGIAGVNWHIKMLPISGVESESDAIEAYNYVRQLRDLYNSTNGEEGAFVVATNLSAGIDNAFPEDHMAWCELFDDLGSVGVLNIAATTNKSESIDIEGDIPSTCPSTFLITVTNVDITDQKPLFAGYGPTHVDLGAPGTFTPTLDINGSYWDFGSTSAAAPHVAGVVSLLYSTPCPTFMDIVKEDPQSAASQVRQILLERTDKLSSLEGLVATQGRLNAFQSMLGISAFCGTTTGFLKILNAYPNPGRGIVRINYQSEDFSPHELVMYDMLGRELMSETVFPPSGDEKVYELDTQLIPPGVYLVVLRSKSDFATIKIIVPT